MGIKEFLSAHISSIVESKGLDLVELRINDRGSHIEIRALVDYPTGGIDMGMCTKINREIVSFLEENSAVLGKDFSVEVSSPGADRKLKTRKDFMRVQGKNVVINLNRPILGKMEITGRALGAKKDFLEVEMSGKKGYTHTVEITYDSINWGKVLF